MTEEFKSQMTFLKTYSESYGKRKEQIAAKRQQLESLQPAVEEFSSIQDEIKELVKQNQSDEKFLISMNEMVLRNTGQPINNGPLFNEEENNQCTNQ